MHFYDSDVIAQLVLLYDINKPLNATNSQQQAVGRDFPYFTKSPARSTFIALDGSMTIIIIDIITI